MQHELHLLRRHRHGEPRAARRRHLLRVGRHGLGESLRAVDGAITRGRASSSRWRPAFPTATRRRITVHDAERRRTSRWRCGGRLGGRRLRGEGERRRRCRSRPLAAPARRRRGGRDGAATIRRAAAELVRRASRAPGRSGDTIELTLPKIAAARADAGRPARRRDHVGTAGARRRPRPAPRGTARGRAPTRRCPCSSPPSSPVPSGYAGLATGQFPRDEVARVPDAAGAAGDVSLAPFYRTHRRTYSVYFDVLTPTEFDARAAAIAAERERQRRIEAATVGVRPAGRPDPEREHNYQSEPADRPMRAIEDRADAAAPAGSRTICRWIPRPRWRSSSRTSTSSACRRRSATSRSTSTARRSRTFAPNAAATGFLRRAVRRAGDALQGQDRRSRCDSRRRERPDRTGVWRPGDSLGRALIRSHFRVAARNENADAADLNDNCRRYNAFGCHLRQSLFTSAGICVPFLLDWHRSEGRQDRQPLISRPEPPMLTFEGPSGAV